MRRLNSLTKNKTEKVRFDPLMTVHLILYANYVKTRKWSSGCPFILEDGFETIPGMINHKISMSILEKFA